MALRASEGLVNKMAAGYGIRDLLRNMHIYAYEGGQPASGDDAPTGSLLVVFTKDGVAFVAATKPQAEITMAGTGTLDTLKVGGAAQNLLSGAVAITGGDLGGSADLVAASINAKENAQHIVAVSDSVSKVTLYQPDFMGVDGNGLTVAITQTTSTCTVDATFTLGVDAVGGMTFDFPALLGKITKPAGETWKGTGLVEGTAGWFRACAGESIPGEAAATRVSFDGVLAGANGDLDMGSQNVLVGVIQTIATLSAKQPQSK